MARTARFLLVLVTLGAGVVAGFSARRRSERVGLPPPRVRAPALERALRAWEAGQPGATRRALETFRALGEAPREDVAEAAYLGALVGRAAEGAAEDLDAALRQVEAAWPRSQGAARAAWERVRRAPTATARQGALGAFAAAHPHAWVLVADPVVGGP